MSGSKGQYKHIHQDLVEKCRRHDRSAQFEIYMLYYKAMYNTSLRIVNNPADAEDIMQEAFLSAFTRLEDYKGEVSFGAWLKRIVVNRSIDALRSRKVVFDELDDQVKEPQEEDNINFLELEEKVKNIKKSIKLLPDGYRIVLSLNLIEGYDHEEISRILNISESGSRSQLARAKKKLIDILIKKGYERY